MPRDRHYLGDIVEAAGHIADFLVGVDEPTFVGSELLKAAVLQELTVQGEATNRLSPKLKAAHPEVPWRKVVTFRNVAVHAYFAFAAGWSGVTMAPA